MRDYIAEANKFMYDDNYIVEAKVKIGGKEYASKKDAGLFLAGQGKTADQIEKTTGLSSAGAKWCIAQSKKGDNKPKALTDKQVNKNDTKKVIAAVSKNDSTTKEPTKATSKKKAVFKDKKEFSEDKPFVRHRQDSDFSLTIKHKNGNVSINVGATIGGNKWKTMNNGKMITKNADDMVKIINYYYPGAAKLNFNDTISANFEGEPDAEKLTAMYNKLDNYLDDLRLKIPKKSKPS